jgi:hypothetical protein
MISKFIRVGMHCQHIGNYFSLFTILGALNFSEVCRKLDVLVGTPTFMFDTLQSLSSSLNPSWHHLKQVQRLKLAWKKLLPIENDLLRSLELVTNPSRNMKLYRLESDVDIFIFA